MSQSVFASSFSKERATATADTVINVVVAGRKNKKTKVTRIKYLCAGTAHTLTYMTPLSSFAKVTTAVTSAGLTVTVDRDPGLYAAYATLKGQATPSVADNGIAANDIIVIHGPDGVPHQRTVSAVTTNSDGTVTLTIAAAPTGGFAAGAVCHFMGIITDTNPNTGLAHQTQLVVVSVVNDYDAGDGGSIVETPRQNQPVVIQSSNATAAGAFVLVSGVYADA